MPRLRIWPFTLLRRKKEARGPWRCDAAGISPIRFRFNGWRFTGVPGDTLASALMANGMSRLGRSARYRRPRGGTAMVRLRLPGGDVVPLVPAFDVEIYHGLNAWSAYWPLRPAETLYGRLKDRIPALLQRLRIPVRRRIRKEKGAADVEYLALHTDLVVVGSGPAGLRRALDAARAGRDVIIVERDFEVGGRLLYDPAPVEGLSAAEWRRAVLDELAANPRVTILMRTTAISRGGTTRLFAVERLPVPARRGNPYLPLMRRITITAAEMAFETGDPQHSFIFKNNDLPGIFHIRDALSLMVRHAVFPGRRVVLYCNHDDAYRFVEAAGNYGLRLAAIIDARAAVPAPCHRLARAAGVPLYPHHEVVKARGAGALRGIVFRKREVGALHVRFDCDALVQSVDPSLDDLPLPVGGKIRKAFASPREERLFTPGAAPHVTEAVDVPERAPGEPWSELLPSFRLTPFRAAFEKAGARMVVRAGWHVAESFPISGEAAIATARREALAAREKAALADLSASGRLELLGPETGEFLAVIAPAVDWAEMPVGAIATLPLAAPGGETVAELFGWRLGEDHYLLTCHQSFSGKLVETVKTYFESTDYSRILFRDVSDDSAALLLAGPRAEAVLNRALPLAVMDEPLAPMTFRRFTQDGLAITLARLDLTGGVGYGIYTGAGHADFLADLLLEKGRDQHLTLIGALAADILRIEAGGLSAAEFGPVANGREAGLTRPLVGLRVVSPPSENANVTRLAPGMTLHEGDGQEIVGAAIGVITSACQSPLFAGDIALARLDGGDARHGSALRAVDPATGHVVDVRVGPPRFYPPARETRHA